MTITVYTVDGMVMIPGASAVDVETKTGLSGLRIPADEQREGWRFTEYADSNTAAAKD